MKGRVTAPPERWILDGLGQNGNEISATQILRSERPGDVGFTACAFLGFHDCAVWISARRAATRPVQEGSRRGLTARKSRGAVAAELQEEFSRREAAYRSSRLFPAFAAFVFLFFIFVVTPILVVLVVLVVEFLVVILVIEFLVVILVVANLLPLVVYFLVVHAVIV